MSKEKGKPFWVIVDENDDVVNVHHRSFGEMKAVFGEKESAEAALAISVRSYPDHIKLRVVAAEIVEPEGNE